MPQGIEIYDAAGVLITGIGTSTLKALTEIGSVDDAGSTSLTFPSGATPLATTSGGTTTYIPTTSISGSTVTWARPAGTSGSMGGRITVNLV